MILLGLVVLGACSGAGSAGSTPPQRAAANGADALVRPEGNVRNPLVQGAACSGSQGFDSFIGVNNDNASPGAAGTVGGGVSNTICDAYGAVLGGSENTVSSGNGTAAFGFVGGGAYNTVAGVGQYGGIGSGEENGVSGEYGYVGGGYSNTASAEWATVSGGNTNTASGNGANVSGGANNTASGAHATVLGGSKNTASGNQSLAAGVGSTAATTGAFVWSDDATDATPLTSTANNQFLARATGGFTLWTNAANTVGARLAPGSGSWSSASDRHMKTDIVALDDAEVLDRVARLPISSWRYITEPGVRHVGPMAQDFYAAFNVGEDDRHITSIDEDGVALAAIKALHEQNALLRARQSATQRELARQRGEIARLSAVVSDLVHQHTR